MGEAWRLFRDTVGEWYEDRAQRLGAALAFYTLFALAPGLVILIPLTGVFLGPQAAQGHIVEQIESLIDRPGAEAIEATIVSAREEGAGVTVVAVITLVFGLWWVFGELQDALNTIWGVTLRPGRGFLVILRERFWSFTLVVGIGFLLLVSLAVSAWLAALSGFFAHLLPAPAMVLEAVNSVISFCVITFLFGMIFKGGGAADRKGQSRARQGAWPEARGAVAPRDQRGGCLDDQLGEAAARRSAFGSGVLGIPMRRSQRKWEIMPSRNDRCSV